MNRRVHRFTGISLRHNANEIERFGGNKESEEEYLSCIVSYCPCVLSPSVDLWNALMFTEYCDGWRSSVIIENVSALKRISNEQLE